MKKQLSEGNAPLFRSCLKLNNGTNDGTKRKKRTGNP